MSSKTKIVLAATLLLGAAAPALANEIETSPSTAQSVREWQEYLGKSPVHMRNVDNPYGYAASPTEQEQLGRKGHGH